MLAMAATASRVGPQARPRPRSSDAMNTTVAAPISKPGTRSAAALSPRTPVDTTDMSTWRGG